MDNEEKNLLNDFASNIQEVLKPTNTLSVTVPEHGSERDLPNLFLNAKSSQKKTFLDLTFDEGVFDLILGTIPINFRSKGVGDVTFETIEASFEIILGLSENLSENGVGVFLLGPLGFGGARGEKFLKRMEEKELFVKGYINLPPKILSPATSLRPILVVISKTRSELILDSLETGTDLKKLCLKFFQDPIDGLRDSIHQAVQTKKPENSPNVIRTARFGISKITSNEEAYPTTEFRGFQSIDIQNQINRLETRYNDFKKIKFEDAIQTYSLGKPGKMFPELENSVYFKVLGTNKSLITDQKDLTGRLENYIQVQLKPEFSNQYLKIFFKSHLGELILQYVFNISFLPRLDRKVLWMTEVPFPNLTIQNQVVETNIRFEKLELEIDQLKKQISLNPQSVSVLSKIDSMLEISNSLTDGDRIKSLVLQGESKALEFKQTFQYCLRTQKKEPYIEVSCLKTLVGFLNSDGGTLFVGVEDSGMFPGIDFEIHEFHRNSHDRFMLHLKDKIKTRLGSQCLSYINSKIVDVDNISILEINCSPSKEEVFLDNKDFYVRTSPSTDKLEGRDLSSYVLKRFKRR